MKQIKSVKKPLRRFLNSEMSLHFSALSLKVILVFIFFVCCVLIFSLFITENKDVSYAGHL